MKLLVGSCNRTLRSVEVDLTTIDLQDQMERLGHTSVIGGERSDAIDHLVAGIARLSSEVNDASSYLPAYDQRTYGEVNEPASVILCGESQS